MIYEWINEAANLLRIVVKRLPRNDSENVLAHIRTSFADPTSKLPIWETLKDVQSRKRKDGWAELCDFIGNSECFLVTEKDGPDVYVILNGHELRYLLSECPGFEFYVTNASYDYILCHNHHDYLIGAGASRDWVASIEDDL